ncbi:MAG: Adaptive-response sensory-kinase SasA [Planctomycetes bacterium]|nr:Adaptive-response sensory-kinase SasA [Planctomycetota bacterium]
MNRSAAPDRAPRLPSPWIVAVPLLVLVLLALRASQRERSAADDAARDSARNAAQRLARAFDTMVTEYVEGLPVPGTEHADVAEALAAAPHLFPRAAFDAELRSVEPEHVARWPRTAQSGAFVAAMLDAADRVREGPAGEEAAAALFAGAASAADDEASALALRLLAEAATARIRDAAGPADVLEPWMTIVTGRAGFDDDLRRRVLDRVEDDLGAALPQPARHRRRLADASRAEAALAISENSRRAWMIDARERPVLGVCVPVVAGGAEIVVAGEIPDTAIRDRIEAEADAIVAEGAADSVRVTGPGGAQALARANAATTATGVEIGAMSVTVPLSQLPAGWSVEATTRVRPAGRDVAMLVGIAAVVAGAALLWGVFALRRSALAHAREARERQSFLDHVAHEVRTPAASLLALGEELASGHVAPDRQALYAQHMHAEARRLARLVEDTLDLSRLDAGRLVYERAPADLRGVARAGIDAVAAPAGGSPPATRLVAPDEPVVVAADAAALSRVVRNLVDNAGRHGGGDAPIEVRVSREGAHGVVTVTDRGRGMPVEVRERLFDRFHRRDEATHETKGVGIGLALCREIVRAHGGAISVRSAEGGEGRGTAVTVRIPLAGGTA